MKAYHRFMVGIGILFTGMRLEARKRQKPEARGAPFPYYSASRGH